MRSVLLAAVFVLVAGVVRAQTPPVVIPSNALTWNQDAPNLATASGYTYKLYADGATTGTTLTGVTCSGTATPFACEVPFPAFSPGSHSVTVSTTNAAGESAKSVAFPFVMMLIPSAPTNLRAK